MLPRIIEIAEQNGLTFNPRTYGKRETTCKCPFCNEDGNKDKWYLSLNTHDNVYKCWYCGVKGGVLDFESRLTNTPYQVVKEKYFPKKENGKKKHGAYTLNNYQLKKIGWDEYKRSSLEGFQKKRDEIFTDWKQHENSELRKLFAMFLVASFVDYSEEQKAEQLELIMNMAEKTGIYLAYSKIVSEFILNEEDRCSWAREGTEIARMAWKASYVDMDFDMEGIFLRVLFLNFRYVDKEYQQNN
ncbi:hypothetical protein ACQKM9_17225 [Viridibacillus sp. NPDC093762]|uniref:hypothetical protein n=1 Tax=Viridibacillus sp. NPDC093762 TaxID=3390720 RepID=UPI003D006CA9